MSLSCSFCSFLELIPSLIPSLVLSLSPAFICSLASQFESPSCHQVESRVTLCLSSAAEISTRLQPLLPSISFLPDASLSHTYCAKKRERERERERESERGRSAGEERVPRIIIVSRVLPGTDFFLPLFFLLLLLLSSFLFLSHSADDDQRGRERDDHRRVLMMPVRAPARIVVVVEEEERKGCQDATDTGSDCCRCCTRSDSRHTLAPHAGVCVRLDSSLSLSLASLCSKFWSSRLASFSLFLSLSRSQSLLPSSSSLLRGIPSSISFRESHVPRSTSFLPLSFSHSLYPSLDPCVCVGVSVRRFLSLSLALLRSTRLDSTLASLAYHAGRRVHDAAHASSPSSSSSSSSAFASFAFRLS